jgi:hypothetical protein
MQTSSERLVEVEAKTTQPPHHSHHRSRQRKRLAAKIVLILALVIAGMAVCDFAFNAYMRTDCMTEADTSYWGVTKPAEPKSESCGVEIAGRDERMQLDATGALVAVALLMGSILASRRLKPHRR